MLDTILFLYPSAIPLTDFILEDSGNGVEIKNWNTGKLGDTPALATLASTIVPPKTQAELDYLRYVKRSQAKDKILDEFAAENMGRIRAGTWTVPNLIALTQDAQLTTLLSNINTLSFELAISSVQSLTNPLITPVIKTSWISKLQANLFLTP
jgi:hypothetical protein